MVNRGKRAADGIYREGIVNGRLRWNVRLVKRDPKSGGKIVDTWRVVYASNLTAASAERDRLLEEELAGRMGPSRTGERVRFAQALDEWLATIDVYGTKQSWGSYAKRIREHFGDWWLDSLTARDVQRYLAGLRRLSGDKPLSAGTVNSHRDVIKHVLRYAQEHGLASANVADQTKRMRAHASRREMVKAAATRKRRAMLTSEVPQFFALLRQHFPDAYPLVRTQFALGCRFSEVSALRHEDVNWSTGVVRIRRAQVRGHVDLPKGSYERTAALGPDALDVLKRHREQMARTKWPGWEDYVFPRPLSTRKKHSNLWSHATVHHAIKQTWRRMGIADQMAGSTHTSRHTNVNIGRRIDAATNRLLVGHQNEAETLTYSMATADEAREHAAAVERAMFGRK